MKAWIVRTIVSTAVLMGLSLAHPASCAPQQPEQQYSSDAASYEQFLDRESSATEAAAPATVPTWTAEPRQEDSIRPSERIRASRTQPDDPELQRILSEKQAASRDTNGEASGELAEYLRSAPSDPLSEATNSEHLMVTILSIAAVAIAGALGGIGVAFLRHRYGTRPDPARRTRLVK